MANNRFIFLQSNFFIYSREENPAKYGNGYKIGPEWTNFVYENIFRYKKVLKYGFVKEKDIFDVNDISIISEWCEENFQYDFLLTAYALLTFDEADHSKFILRWCDKDMSNYLKEVKDIEKEGVSLETFEKVWGKDLIDKLESQSLKVR